MALIALLAAAAQNRDDISGYLGVSAWFSAEMAQREKNSVFLICFESWRTMRTYENFLIKINFAFAICD